MAESGNDKAVTGFSVTPRLIGKHDSNANASLIAAAPDLLEALEQRWFRCQNAPCECPMMA